MLIRLGRKKPKSLCSVLRGIECYKRLLMAGGVLMTLFSVTVRAAPPKAVLPVPCGGGACVARGGPSQWVSHGQASLSLGNRSMTVHQASDKAILNWQNFDIAAGHSVTFDQPGVTSVALNRIFQGAPSSILGNLRANGQVYLLNQNGIVFGAGSQVNVSALLASSLNIRDADFLGGITQPILNPGTPHPVLVPFADASGNVITEPGSLIETQEGGKVMLFAPIVTNGGTIRTPRGQTILAAGDKIYLEVVPATSPELRGLWVEADLDPNGPNKDLINTVTNSGTILTERGNATLVGLAVNQHGRVSATTALSENGSIRLLARSGAEPRQTQNQTPQRVVATKTGTLTLGEDSVTEVLPDASDASTAPRSSFYEDGKLVRPSSVEMMGNQIELGANSTVRVPGGRVTINALADPRSFSESSGQVEIPQDKGSRILLAAGSVIDVSGTETDMAMERNQLEVELRGTQLADSPAQRDGVLKGQKVSIDIRTGTPLANVQAAIDTLAYNVNEKYAQGGTVTLKAQGDVILNTGAAVDVSGGAFRFKDGFINTTKLVSGGRLYDIGAADPSRIYDGIVGDYSKSYYKWGVTDTRRSAVFGSKGQFHPGYVEGQRGGTVQIEGYQLAIADGTLRGGAQRGSRQREAVLGGQLIIGRADGNDLMTPEIRLQAQRVSHQLSAADVLEKDLPLRLSTQGLQDSGFARIELYSNDTITLEEGAALALPAGGALSLIGHDLNIAGSIRVSAGSISLQSKLTNDTTNTDYGIRVGAHAVLDVGGRWVNDQLFAAGSGANSAALIKGGDVKIKSAGEAQFAPGSVVDASGGAWLKANNSLKKGNGGTIDIAVEQLFSQVPNLELGGELKAHAPGKGGTLRLTASGITIQNQAGEPAPGQLLLTPEFFQQGGFSAFELTANRDDLRVVENTRVKLAPTSLVFGGQYALQADGADIETFSTPALLPTHQRAPAKLALRSTMGAGVGSYNQAGMLAVENGAVLDAGNAGQVTFHSERRIEMQGEIHAAGGTITAQLGEVPSRLGSDFHTDRTLWLGEHGVLDAAGTAVLQPNAQGVKQGQVLAGGAVALNAGDGVLVTAAGSRIDVSGAPAELDLPAASGVGYVNRRVGSHAGTVRATSSEGMRLAGEMRAASGTEHNAGGSFIATFYDGTDKSPARQRTLHVRDTNHLDLPADMQPGAAVPAGLYGRAEFASGALARGEFDQIALSSSESIRLDADVTLDATRAVTLDAPVLEMQGAGEARVSAAYVALGTTQSRTNPPLAPTPGDGVLRVEAQLVDIVGHSSLQGIKQTDIHSSGDVRLRGVVRGGLEYSGSLSAVGELNIGADQIYPTTLSEFAINVQKDANATGASGVIRIAPGDGTTPVLSAAGKLTLNATRIQQGGVLKAPLGALTLNATESLTLAPGSITSVAGEATVPLGKTQNGEAWVYEFNGQQRLIDAPQKHLQLLGPAVDVQSGATVDVSGGGDIVAYEFAPGPGGSRDVLANSSATSSTNGYAILPGLNSEFAPYDEQEFASSGLVPGDSVYLSGAHGLPAGRYALLPAHYALLPGAYLITPVAGYQDLSPQRSVTQLDGTPVVAGYRTAAGTGVRDSRWSGFAVRSGTGLNDKQQYAITTSDAFFSARAQRQEVAVPRLARDAGALSVVAKHALRLDGNIDTSVPSGRNAAVDLSASQLRVVADAAAAPQSEDAGVRLDVETLNALGAESLLLGGARTRDAAGVHIDTVAQRVTVEAGATLRAPEVILVAKDEVRVAAGATVEGSGTIPSAPGETLSLDGDGAMLRVAAASQVQVRRVNSSGATGVLEVDEGATLRASRSMTLDASQATRMRGMLDMNGGSLNLGATQVSVGAVPDGTAGLVLTERQLAGFSVDELVLTSRNAVNIHGAVDLHAKNLAIEAQGLTGHGLGSEQAANITAGSFRMANPNPSTAVSRSGSGTLNIRADDVVLGAGSYAISGYERVNVEAAREIRGSGVGELKVAGELQLTTPRITGEKRAATHITAVDETNAANPAYRAVRIALPGTAPVDLDRINALGAALTVTGKNVTHAGRIELPAGRVALNAKGADASDAVTLAAGARIDAAGAAVAFGDTVKYAPGGSVELTSAHGDVEVADGARVDVSGAPAGKDGPAGGDAGRLVMRASEGTVQVDGVLRGQAEPGYRGGEFLLDAKVLAAEVGGNGYSRLNTKLSAGDFSARQDLRVRAGDVAIAQGDQVTAHEYQLVADGGRIDVHGGIDASGTKGGRIDLYAANGVTLSSSANLTAHATEAATQAAGSAGDGGRVVVGVGENGAIEAQSGARINVAAAGAGQAGRVLLRAPRVKKAGATTDNDVAVTAFGDAAVQGGDTIVEAYKIYDNVNSLDTLSGTGVLSFSTVAADSAAFMKNMGTIKGRLNKTTDAAFHLRPGVEVRSGGDLALANDWTLHTERYDRVTGDAVTGKTELALGASANGALEPGLLTLRAKGDINFKFSLSDGFDGALAESRINDGGESWSYRIAAGADTASADPLAVLPLDLAAKGSVTVDSGSRKISPVNVVPELKMIRTGSGDIDIAAARDVKLGNQQSVIYTAGTPTQRRRFPVNVTKTAVYPDQGGDVRIRAQRDVIGAASDQLVTGWLHRRIEQNAGTWWVDYRYFQQNAGALGGGDVTVRAGRDVREFSVMVPTNRPLDGAAQGGGDVQVRAAGDVTGGVYYVGAGQGSIQAGGEVRSERPNTYTLLGLGDGQWTLQAIGNVGLLGIFNPTVTTRTLEQSQTGVALATPAYMFTYGSNSAVEVASVSGDIVLSNDQGAIRALMSAERVAESNLDMFGYAPPTLRLGALSGDVSVHNGFTLFPDTQGQLEIYAGGNITGSGAGIGVRISDADPRLMPSVDRPQTLEWEPPAHASETLHSGDRKPVRIVARDGDIREFSLDSAKPVSVAAGRDIVDLELRAQNLDEGDVTSIRAGRDIVYTTPRAAGTGAISTSDKIIEVAGPGQLHVQAGRDIDLGSSQGILSIGRNKNPALPPDGADVLVVAGVKGPLDYNALQAHYRDQYSAGSERLKLLTASLRTARQDHALTEAQVLDELRAYPEQFGSEIFFNELKLAGRARDYEAGRSAIKALFPGSHDGDVKLFFSQIRTLSGGDIELLVPGGEVNAGLATPPGGFKKEPGELGIVAQGKGRVRGYARDHFTVNQSRVFALRGGDITLWSDTGNIDAGRGAKSVVSAPPPLVSTDADGNTVTVVQGAAAGSGIRIQLTTPGDRAGDVDLIAPEGEVNAGDAGIGSAGDLYVAAPRVVGADNIQVSGTSSGVPVADTGGLGASLGGVSNLASGASNTAEQAMGNLGDAKESSTTPIADSALTFLEVEVLGYGDEVKGDENKKEEQGK